MNNHTETPPQPQDTIIRRIEISQSYKDQALEQVKALVKGNKCDPNSIELKEFEGEVLHFQAENMLTLVKKVSHTKVPGRLETAIKVDNEIAANDAMTKAYLTLADDQNTERMIRDKLLKRDDKGFGVHDIFIPIPSLKKEFVVFEPCHTCKTTGSVTCLPCSGKGAMPCPRCKGTGMGHCTHCNGAQMINGPNNKKIQCPVCHGRGRTTCLGCNQSGRAQCKTCASRGATPCPNCQGNAWSSILYTLDIQVRTDFDYPKDKLPEKVTNLIDQYGACLLYTSPSPRDQRGSRMPSSA